jgi:2-amino-4-hydroxy-6-hydroxymethyldihydropteridine diphosphokinase
MPAIYLLTGSNIGDSAANLHQAFLLIERQIGRVEAASSVYQTEPWGNKDQQVFLNQVLLVQTELSPDQVLKTLLDIEQGMGRNRIVKWEPRIIDIDILFYDQLILSETGLTIPHPLLHQRRFVLTPLNEIAPAYVHPVFHRTISELLAGCPDTGTVEKL